MKPLSTCIAAALVASLSSLPVSAQPGSSRGAMLYENHCGACHTTQMHWRQQRAATDWSTLRALVNRWQGAAQLRWSDDEIDDVASHLNDRFYRFEAPTKRLSLLVR